MKKIISISGKGESGKDTTANILKKVLEKDNNRVVILHHADLLKFYCKQYFGWNGEKDFEGRKLLQWLGTDIVRTKNPDYWVNEIKGFISLFEDTFDYFLIPDCRFPNEVQYKNGISLRIERPNHENQLTAEQRQHASETSLDNTFHDYILVNDGTLDDLELKIIKFIKIFSL